MKNIVSFFLAFVLCSCVSIACYAGDKETTQDASNPRLMVVDYKIEGENLTPDKKSKVTVTLKNYSKTKYIENIKLSVTEDSGDIKPVGTGNKYVDRIPANGTYIWEIELTVSPTAQIGEHAVKVSSEYEDKYYVSYSGSDVIRMNVKQTVGLDFCNVQLPDKVYSDDNATMDISLLNTGKSNIRNCKIDFDIIGLESGGTTYVGEISAGEQCSASANLRVGKELGDIKGTVIITYEDEFGKSYKKEQAVRTTIVEKPIEPETEEEYTKYPFWWAFFLGGIVLGGSAGCVIPIAIYKNRQRKEDEMRL